MEWATDRVNQILEEQAKESGLHDIEGMDRKEQERRRAPRFSLEEPVRVEVETWEQLIELYTKDISQNGIFIRSTSPPAVGTEIGIHLLLPDGTGTVQFKGSVVRVATPEQTVIPGFGVQFHEISQQAHHTLQWIVAQAKAATKRPVGSRSTAWRMAGEDGHPRSSKEDERIEKRRLRTVLCELGAQTDLAALGLHGTPTVDQIDQAYAQLDRQWNPRHAGKTQSIEIINLYKAIHFRIEKAYRRSRAAATFSADAFTSALDNVTTLE